MKLILPILLFFILVGQVKSVKADFAEKFQSDLYQGYLDLKPDFDLVFTGPDGHENWFPAHTQVLKRSHYLNSVLSRKYPPNRTGVIVFETTSLDTFKRLLYFLYQNEIELDQELDLLDLIKAQEQLNISGLDEEIIGLLNDENSLSRLSKKELAELLIFVEETHLRNKKEFKESILQYIIDHKSTKKSCSPGLVKRVKGHPALVHDLKMIFKVNHLRAGDQIDQKEYVKLKVKFQKKLFNLEKKMNRVFNQNNQTVS